MMMMRLLDAHDGQLPFDFQAYFVSVCVIF